MRPLKKKPRASKRSEIVDDTDDEPLSPKLARCLRRQIADSRNSTRYLIVSRFGPRFALYYDVGDDVYGMNCPERGTLFKRRRTALAVKNLLGERVQVIRCETRLRGGKRVPLLPRSRRSRIGG